MGTAGRSVFGSHRAPRLPAPTAYALALAMCCSACLGLSPRPMRTLSEGSTNRGRLRHGVPLPDRGEGYVRARPGESTRYGTPELIALIERGAAAVHRAFPGTAPLRIGDLSAPRGGRHPRHGSHRAGRDVDVLFYVTDASGRSVRGRGWLAYNRFGFAVDRPSPDDAEAPSPSDAEGSEVPTRPDPLYFFDTARNWYLVRTWLADGAPSPVQWIFVSRGVKARLLAYGRRFEPDPVVLARAAIVMAQPADASPHDDHFHVRIVCSQRDLASGCRNRRPMWPWLRFAFEKPPRRPGSVLDDRALVEALLSPDSIDPAPTPEAATATRPARAATPQPE